MHAYGFASTLCSRCAYDTCACKLLEKRVGCFEIIRLFDRGARVTTSEQVQWHVRSSAIIELNMLSRPSAGCTVSFLAMSQTSAHTRVALPSQVTADTKRLRHSLLLSQAISS